MRLTREEMEREAITRVTAKNPEKKGFTVSSVYANVMDGTIITVSFPKDDGTRDYNHIHFDNEGRVTPYRWHSEIVEAVSHYKERNWFFRFLEFAGTGGLIAVMLVMVFSLLLVALAFKSDANPSIVEVVKLSLTTILGFFFGQASGKK